MRFADGPTVEVEIRVAAPPERIWPFVSDIGVPPRFSGEVVETAWLPGFDGPAPGARFTGRNEHRAIGVWESSCTVTECEPPLRFGWEVAGGDGPGATWRFELVADGDATILREWARLGPGASGLTPAIQAMPDKEERIIERRLGEWRAGMERCVEGIRELAESSET